MIDRRIAAAAAALAILGLVLTGCVGVTRDAGTSPVGSVGADATRSVTGTATPTTSGATTTAEPNGDSSGSSANGSDETPGPKGSGAKGSQVTGADLAAIEKQLEAMQNEIDSLEMPGDNDFSGAEDAVY